MGRVDRYCIGILLIKDSYQRVLFAVKVGERGGVLVVVLATPS
jgi:hypothetical protein